MSKSVSTRFSQTNIKSEKTKLRDRLEENDKIKSLTMDLKEDLKAVNKNLKHIEREKSDIQCRLLEEQTKCAELDTECSKLRSELCEEQRLHKDIQTVFSDFKEQTYNAVDKEIENHRRIEKLHLQKVNELKIEIKRLKSELSNSGTTSNSTKVQTGAHQGMGAEMGKISVENSQPRTTYVGASQVPGCRKCRNAVYHPPRLCPATCVRTLCVKSAPNEGNTYLTVYTYAEVEVVKEYHAMILQTVFPKYMNCAYCSIKGHLALVCLQKCYDELGY